MFTIIGATPLESFTGTLTFTSLSVRGTFPSKAEARVAFQKLSDECCGMVLVVNEKGDDVTYDISAEEGWN